MKQVNAITGVCFFRVEQSMALREFLFSRDFSPLTVLVTIDEWLDYGSVYVDGRRQRENIPLHEAQLVRVHTRRKNYPMQPLGPWVVEDNEHFLVLDKPGGVPTHPTLDNYIANAKTLLERELGIPLFTTHRLDILTQGLLIIAKSQDAQWRLNRLFSLQRVDKIYRSHNAAAVAPGLYTHYMDPESRVPKVVQSGEHEGWWKCQLRVERMIPVNDHFGHEITLLTGKTHQIRAQMLALGAAVLGDPVYAGLAVGVRERMELECYQLAFSFRSRNFIIRRPKSLLDEALPPKCLIPPDSPFLSTSPSGLTTILP